MNSARISKSFWKGKKVFITGHTGFKGTWLTMLLLKVGARVSGISNDQKALFRYIEPEIEHDYNLSLIHI